MEPSFVASIPIAFAVSMELPPPIANTASLLLFFKTSAALSHTSIGGSATVSE